MQTSSSLWKNKRNPYFFNSFNRGLYSNPVAKHDGFGPLTKLKWEANKALQDQILSGATICPVAELLLDGASAAAHASAVQQNPIVFSAENQGVYTAQLPTFSLFQRQCLFKTSQSTCQLIFLDSPWPYFHFQKLVRITWRLTSSYTPSQSTSSIGLLILLVFSWVLQQNKKIPWKDTWWKWNL